MDELDYWRLCDELNIVQAAFLIAGEAPTFAEYAEKWEVDKRPRGYEAAKTAITHALRRFHTVSDDEKIFSEADINSGNAEALRSGYIEGTLIPQYETDINGNNTMPIEGSIDLFKSTVMVSSLKRWLRWRGLTTGFFFPEDSADTPDYLDPNNPRYAPKLAAAIHAWLAVTNPGKTSPKKALDKWLRENAAQFGLTDDDGLPINQAVEDCSKVANWNQTGGAPKTPTV